MQRITLSHSPLSAAQVCPHIGHGSSIGHHGEILQGVFEDSTGCLRRGLVTLLSTVFRSEAVFMPDDGDVIRTEPAWKVKARRAAELVLANVSESIRGGRLTIDSNIPPAWGFGSSTSDVTAVVRAVADSVGVALPPREIASMAVAAETASDAVMFSGQTVLFAQRDGLVIEEFAGPLPAMQVLGFNTDPCGVDTLSFPPARYSWWEIEAFRPLLALIRRAVCFQEPGLVGQAASASARINQRYLPKPRFDRIERLVERVGALGLQVAHSGTLIGLLFDPADVLLEERLCESQTLLAEMDFASTWRFLAGGDYSIRKFTRSFNPGAVRTPLLSQPQLVP